LQLFLIPPTFIPNLWISLLVFLEPHRLKVLKATQSNKGLVDAPINSVGEAELESSYANG